MYAFSLLLNVLEIKALHLKIIFFIKLEWITLKLLVMITLKLLVKTKNFEGFSK